MYVTRRSRMSLIMDVIRSELSKLSALELEKFAIFDFIYTVTSTNTNQSAPNLITIYVIIRSRMSSVMVIIGPEHPELFALEFGKIAEFDFVYTLASTNINQLEPNLVKKKKKKKTCPKISDDFDCGCNQTRTVQVTCP